MQIKAGPGAAASLIPLQQRGLAMPMDSMMVITAVTVVFVVFAGVLACADFISSRTPKA
jgi:small neutral amino acid transporter SnatA (MarC family)